MTRLKVSGFKNLVDVDVSFGAFTCVAGANGVGKSNLFDAIRFLCALADHTLIDAARMVRDDSASNWNVVQQKALATPQEIEAVAPILAVVGKIR